MVMQNFPRGDIRGWLSAAAQRLPEVGSQVASRLGQSVSPLLSSPFMPAESRRFLSLPLGQTPQKQLRPRQPQLQQAPAEQWAPGLWEQQATSAPQVSVQDLVDDFWASARTVADVDNLEERIRALLEEQGVPPFQAAQRASQQALPFRQTVEAEETGEEAAPLTADERVQAQMLGMRETPAAAAEVTPVTSQPGRPVDVEDTILGERTTGDPRSVSEDDEDAIRAARQLLSDARLKVSLGDPLTTEDIEALTAYNEAPTQAQISGVSQVTGDIEALGPTTGVLEALGPTTGVTDGGEISYEFPSGVEPTYGRAPELGLPPTVNEILEGQMDTLRQQGIPDTSPGLWEQQLAIGDLDPSLVPNIGIEEARRQRLRDLSLTPGGQQTLFYDALREAMGGEMLTPTVMRAAARQVGPLQAYWQLASALTPQSWLGEEGQEPRTFADLLRTAPSPMTGVSGDFRSTATPYGQRSFLPGMLTEATAALGQMGDEALAALPERLRAFRTQMLEDPSKQIALAQNVYRQQVPLAFRSGFDRMVQDAYQRQYRDDPTTPFLVHLAQQGGLGY
jgi:hypothetical protein